MRDIKDSYPLNPPNPKGMKQILLKLLFFGVVGRKS